MYLSKSIEQFLAGKDNIEPDDREFTQKQIGIFDDCGRISAGNIEYILGKELAEEFIEVCKNNPLLKFGPTIL